MPADDFVGHWTVDASQSDSIEPMLKGMGVGWRIRKIVAILKVVQKIEVKGNNLLVSNISKHGQDTTTHIMNVGERVIKTNRGDAVIDNCTYDEKREFPLEIVAILPSNKGSTVDRRKVLPGGESFVQHLIYRFPDGSANEEILMKRVFVRLSEDSTEIPQPVAAKGGEKDPLSVKVNGGSYNDSSPSSASSLRHRKSPNPDSEAPTPSDAHHSVPSSVHSHITTLTGTPVSTLEGKPSPTASSSSRSSAASGPEKLDEPSSPDLWILSVLSMMAFTVLYAGVKSGSVNLTTISPALILLFSLFGATRIFARTEKGARLVLNAKARWGIFLVSLIVSTFVYFSLVENTSDTNLRVLGFIVASSWIIFSRVNAAPVVDILDQTTRSALVAISVPFTAVACLILGPMHRLSMGIAFVTGMLLFAIFYEVSIGYGRFDARRSEPTPEPKKIFDKEGSTLSVSVVGFRVVDDLYAQYKLKVQHEGMVWFVWRRFSQFDNLRHELRRVFAHGVLPTLPKKTWFSSLDEDFLQDRTSELDEFIQKLFDASTLKTQVFKIAETKKFLGVGQGRGRKTGATTSQAPAQRSNKATPEETKVLIDVLKQCDAAFEKALSVGEGDGWKFLKKYNGVQCYLKTEGDLTFTKGVGTIDFPPLVVASFMSDLTKRKAYDDLFKKDTLVRELDLVEVSESLNNAPIDVCDLKHVEFKSPFPLAISARDTLLVQSRTIYPDGTVKVLLASPPDSFLPPTSKYVRAKVFAAGILLAPNPAKPGTSIMSNVQMMDPNGSIPGYVVKAVAPERCAMSAKVEEALKKLTVLPEPLKIPNVPSRAPENN